VRFDDTNPSKEKGEYADNIIRDLATLNIKADKITHTSDSFEICQNYARQMISAGLAYMDDTDQEKMQAERMNRINSYRRDTPVEENLEIFEGLLSGAPEYKNYCLRAKIDMNSVNGTMRDPVLYRYNDIPHHRTGTKYKAYPTYDFACPIVDAVEGVTHALRTTEYNDRDEQFQWIAKALGLRHVHIMTYGKINFIYTVLSKRKLNWFVEQQIVDGWNDPRFPTIQGCIRRGMNVDSLKKFIISQGASRRVINMEWDKFWSENKKVLEGIAPRYMANSAVRKVLMKITNVGPEVVVDSVQIHPQKPEMGIRALRKYNAVYLEMDDCNTFSEGEEVTLMRWGNFFVDKITKNDNGDVVSIEARYHPEATNFSKTKKVTWVAAIPDLVPCKLVEFDHLITEPILKDGSDFKDFVTPVSRAETDALGDPYLRTVQKGEVVQLERKGFFRCDKPYGGSPDKPAVLFLIPDGRVKAMSTLSSALSHR
jgi:glutamyl-tRNA synthetase